MAKTKTTYTNVSISDFLESFVESESKKSDSLQIISLFEKWSGFEPKMWGPSIIGFGNYHYTYASGHEGDAPIIAFSPRKNALTFYIYCDTEFSQKKLLELGKYTKSKACIYVKKLSDIHIDVLKELCLDSIQYVKDHPNYSC